MSDSVRPHRRQPTRLPRPRDSPGKNAGVGCHLVARTLKRLPTMWETWVRSLGQEDPLEKEMATHTSTLAWRIPWTEEPGRAVVHGVAKSRTRLSDFLSLFIFMHWRRKWQPTPVFLPGESQGRGSLVGCRLWGHTESDTTEATQQQQHGYVIAT